MLRWLTLALAVGLVHGDSNSSWPHDYPGMPTSEFSPVWQECTLYIILVNVLRNPDLLS